MSPPDILKVHSDLGARGWRLEPTSPDAPKEALGLYRRRGKSAWLVRDGDGFRLEPAGAAVWARLLAETPREAPALEEEIRRRHAEDEAGLDENLGVSDADPGL